MGDLGDGQTDTLDERMWGDDENDEDDVDSDKEEESGSGMDPGESELVAKDDNMDAGESNKDKNQDKDLPKDEEEKEKIHEQLDEVSSFTISLGFFFRQDCVKRTRSNMRERKRGAGSGKIHELGFKLVTLEAQQHYMSIFTISFPQ